MNSAGSYTVLYSSVGGRRVFVERTCTMCGLVENVWLSGPLTTPKVVTAHNALDRLAVIYKTRYCDACVVKKYEENRTKPHRWFYELFPEDAKSIRHASCRNDNAQIC